MIPVGKPRLSGLSDIRPVEWGILVCIAVACLTVPWENPRRVVHARTVGETVATAGKYRLTRSGVAD
jgi:hypothetical protein